MDSLSIHNADPIIIRQELSLRSMLPNSPYVSHKYLYIILTRHTKNNEGKNNFIIISGLPVKNRKICLLFVFYQNIFTFVKIVLTVIPMEDSLLYTKISLLSDKLKGEVNDFIDFLLNKNFKKSKPHKRQAGFLKGTFEIMEDFDDPIEDFKEYMK